jgi:hypothetical protein
MTNIELHHGSFPNCAALSIPVWGVQMLPNVVAWLRRLFGNPGLAITRGCLIGMALFFLSLTGCGTAEEQGSLAPTGTTVSLVWDSVNDPNIVGYYIHYGKQSPNQSGSCAYDRAIFTESHQGIVTGLDPGSTYYFAVSAYNGERGHCSNEVSAQA